MLLVMQARSKNISMEKNYILLYFDLFCVINAENLHYGLAWNMLA